MSEEDDNLHHHHRRQSRDHLLTADEKSLEMETMSSKNPDIVATETGPDPYGPSNSLESPTRVVDEFDGPLLPVYRVYKRRFFGLFQLVLLNIIVSWDVCCNPPRFLSPTLIYSSQVVDFLRRLGHGCRILSRLCDRHQLVKYWFLVCFCHNQPVCIRLF